MSIWHHHQMPACIREEIENDEIQRVPIDNVGLFIVLSCGDAAKNAAGVLSDRGDVLITPGAPDMFHNSLAQFQRSTIRSSALKRVRFLFNESGATETILVNT